MFDSGVESRRTLVLCAGVLSCAFALVYLPDVGHGLAKDDFGWIAHSSVRSWQDAVALFRTAPTNFFRPVVSLSFAVTVTVELAGGHGAANYKSKPSAVAKIFPVGAHAVAGNRARS